MPAGRNTKLTPETTEKICKALREGNTRRVSAILGGIGESTFYDWLERADPKHDNFDERYAEFSEAVARAEAEYEAEMVEVIRRDARNHPKGNGFQAAFRWLEKRKPQDWGDKSQVKQTNVNINLEELNDEELDMLTNGEDPERVYKLSRARREREAQTGSQKGA